MDGRVEQHATADAPRWLRLAQGAATVAVVLAAAAVPLAWMASLEQPVAQTAGGRPEDATFSTWLPYSVAVGFVAALHLGAGYSFRGALRGPAARWSPVTRTMLGGFLLSFAFFVGVLVFAHAVVGPGRLPEYPPSRAAVAVYLMLLVSTFGAASTWLLNHRLDKERRLAEDEAQAESARQEFQTRLLNTAAHELNTPLTPIRAELEMMEMGLLGPITQRQKEAIAIALRNADRLATMVRDIMEANRIGGAHRALRLTHRDLRETLQEAVDNYTAAATRAGLTIELSIDGPLWVNADRERILQILFNLLDNAIKFSGDGGTVRLTGWPEDGEVVVTVEDNGRGMDEAQLAGLFRPFGQVHDDYPAGMRGSGLGLYICHELAAEHGGTLSAQSDGPGVGSRFTLRLPLAPAPEN